MTSAQFNFADSRNRVLDELATQFFSGFPEDSTIFHYTDSSSLISIVSTKALWASNIDFLNDRLELDLADSVILSIVDSLACPEMLKRLLRTQYSKFKKETSRRTYVLSFSTEFDSLNLWNNYGKNDGYNLGFAANPFLVRFINKEFPIVGSSQNSPIDYKAIGGLVIYDPVKQVEIFKHIFEEFVTGLILLPQMSKKEATSLTSFFWETIIWYSYLIKGKPHSIEKEFRIVISPKRNGEGQSFRSRGGVILPYLKIELTDLANLQTVCVGPKVNESVAASGLRAILSANRCRPKLHQSKLKLRF